MKKIKKFMYAVALFISVCLSFLLGRGVVFAETQVISNIEADTVWGMGGSPYVINDYVEVGPGVNLTIDPGVAIKFKDSYLSVYGSLQAHGTSAAPVTLSSLEGSDAWNLSFFDSTSTLSHVNIQGSRDPIYAFHSHLNIDHLTASNLSGPVSFDTSTVNISESDFGNSGNVLVAYNRSKVTVRDSVFHDLTYFAGSILAYAGADLSLRNVTVENINQGDAIAVYGKARLEVSSSTISHGQGGGITAYGNAQVELKNIKIHDFGTYGISAYDTSLRLEKTAISKNDIGVDIYGPVEIEAQESSVVDNVTFGVRSLSAPTTAANIWWGDASGPLQETVNSAGAGNAVTDNVVVSPWLTEDPFVEKCCSNVAFIPGLEASRLYAPGFLSENKLWEPNLNADAEKLFMDPDGKSLRSDIYTRDVIDDVYTPLIGKDIYGGFEKEMDSLVAAKTINAWKALPYDWRLSLTAVVNGGVENAKGDISYLSDTPPAISHMILSLSQLSRSAKNGKVTIVTHSNGGLVAKVLIQKLQELKSQGKSDLLDHIDRVVMVSVPQLGSADAIGALLHGYKLNYAGGLVLDNAYGRAMGENMPGAYTLLPSQKYFSKIKEPIVTFSSSTEAFSNLAKFYSSSISDYAGLQKFLIGADGRKDPEFWNVFDPNVLNGKLNQEAVTQHENIDNWQFPENIEVTQIAGWGLQTLKGLQYKKQDCFFEIGCVNRLAMDPAFSVEGDGTVLYPSAVDSYGKQLYFNLRDYNLQSFSKNRKHDDILETSSIKELVKNILTETPILPPYITPIKPETKDGKLVVSMTASTTLSAKDLYGNRTGVALAADSKSDVKVIQQNIPNSFYADFGGAKFIGLDDSSPAQITFAGGGYGTFTVTATKTLGDDPVSSSVFADIPLTPQMAGEIISSNNLAPMLSIDVDGNGTIDATTTPKAAFDPILYLEIMKKTVESFELKSAAELTLIVKLEQLKNSIKTGKIKNAEKQIQKFVRKIDHTSSSKKISGAEREAFVQMLTNLANNII